MFNSLEIDKRNLSERVTTSELDKKECPVNGNKRECTVGLAVGFRTCGAMVGS